MNRFLYQLRIAQTPVTCLGAQFASILKSIKHVVSGGVWYGSDIDTSCDNLKIMDLRSGIPGKIGSMEEMIQFSESIHQFLSGVFVLMPLDSGKFLNEKYFTEDDQFREAGNIILEIRTFDTTCFMIFSNNLELLNSLSKGFSGKISYSSMVS